MLVYVMRHQEVNKCPVYCWVPTATWWQQSLSCWIIYECQHYSFRPGVSSVLFMHMHTCCRCNLYIESTKRRNLEYFPLQLMEFSLLQSHTTSSCVKSSHSSFHSRMSGRSDQEMIDGSVFTWQQFKYGKLQKRETCVDYSNYPLSFFSLLNFFFLLFVPFDRNFSSL